MIVDVPPEQLLRPRSSRRRDEGERQVVDHRPPAEHFARSIAVSSAWRAASAAPAGSSMFSTFDEVEVCQRRCAGVDLLREARCFTHVHHGLGRTGRRCRSASRVSGTPGRGVSGPEIERLGERERLGGEFTESASACREHLDRAQLLQGLDRVDIGLRVEAPPAPRSGAVVPPCGDRRVATNVRAWSACGPRIVGHRGRTYRSIARPAIGMAAGDRSVRSQRVRGALEQLRRAWIADVACDRPGRRRRRSRSPHAPVSRTGSPDRRRA